MASVVRGARWLIMARIHASQYANLSRSGAPASSGRDPAKAWVSRKWAPSLQPRIWPPEHGLPGKGLSMQRKLSFRSFSTSKKGVGVGQGTKKGVGLLNKDIEGMEEEEYGEDDWHLEEGEIGGVTVAVDGSITIATHDDERGVNEEPVSVGRASDKVKRVGSNEVQITSNAKSTETTNSRGSVDGQGGEKVRSNSLGVREDWDKEREARKLFRQLKEKRGTEKWDFFRWICEKGKSNVFHFNTMMGSIGSIAAGFDLFDSMSKLGIKPDVVTYSTFMHKAVNQNKMDVAESILVEMLKQEVKPNVHVFSTLIDGYGKQLNLTQARYSWDRMLQAGVVPAVQTYTSLMNAYAKLGDIQQCEVLFKKLVTGHDGVKPNVQAFTVMIDAYARLGMLQECQRVFRVLQKTEGVTPDTTIFNLMISAHDKIGDLPEVLELVGKMEGMGIEKNLMTYTSIMDSYGKRGLAKEASEWFKKMQAVGIVPDAIAYSCLVDAYGKTGRHGEAALYLKEARTKGLATSDAATALVDSFCNFGELDKAESLLRDMKASEDPLGRPQMETYMALIMGYEKVGKPKAVVEIHKDMKEQGLVGDPGYYQTYLRVLSYAGLWTSAREAFQEAFDEGLDPFYSSVTVGRTSVRLDVHGMSPGAAAVAVDWLLRRAPHRKHSLVIVTGKPQTYTYDHNQLRAATEQHLQSVNIVWKVADGRTTLAPEDDLTLQGGRLVVSSREWYNFRRRAKLPEPGRESKEALSEYGRHDEDGDEDGDEDEDDRH